MRIVYDSEGRCTIALLPGERHELSKLDPALIDRGVRIQHTGPPWTPKPRPVVHWRARGRCWHHHTQDVAG